MHMGDEEQQIKNYWEGYVNWRNRAAVKGLHGGMLAASFVLGVEVMENLAYLANASNLVLYLSKFMHFSPSTSANIVTNFMGTAFLLALLGGFLSDAFFSTYLIYLISAAVELAGLSILTVQARAPSLKPAWCVLTDANGACQEANGGKAAILFMGLYLVALGVGGIKGSLPPHGAEQFDETTPQGRKQRSAFFNYYVFCLSCGALIAVTFVVWIEDNKGWQWGFGISALAILISIPIFLLGSTTYRIKIPSGSPITTIFKVLIATACNSFTSRSHRNSTIISLATSPPSITTDSSNNEGGSGIAQDQKGNVPNTSRSKCLNFLHRAVTNKPLHPALECTITQVEEAATMNTQLGSLRIPPASLPIFPVVFIIILAPFYNHIIIPFARKVNKTEMGITHLQRIGTGLVLSIIAMAVAALVEIKRKGVAAQYGLLNSAQPLPLTFLWIAFQYLFLGSADLFTLAGMMEFFFTEAPLSMRSLATALAWASLAMGYYLSSVLVSTVNRVTGNSQHQPWLFGSNLNHCHLERFYWLMCVLSGLNFLHYLLWASRYKYRPMRPDN
ncbi:protein NRT1/ PTR FAMILY 4.6-like isoform X2 [Malania oleifera]|uniref:protein NRT1/ PTR FAMILY 4.6-like isoform X2 n=1 Tax=Malania oleifera TaxID=397392 RepID=UPI0025AE7DBD|nr:protein NRT1/ PTR FAMILY 4.6-like isoform X2 [Malania oleifera]